jgi:hypothetical protein
MRALASYLTEAQAHAFRDLLVSVYGAADEFVVSSPDRTIFIVTCQKDNVLPSLPLIKRAFGVGLLAGQGIDHKRFLSSRTTD